MSTSCCPQLPIDGRQFEAINVDKTVDFDEAGYKQALGSKALDVEVSILDAVILGTMLCIMLPSCSTHTPPDGQ